MPVTPDNISNRQTIRMQWILVVVSLTLFILKLIAWWLTGSIAILTDTLESIVNVVAGFIGLYSIILSAKPKDKEHPYGHGKVEFISSAIEGILIATAGLIIIIEAVNNFWHPHSLKKLDVGLILIAVTAVINFVVGRLCIEKGKKENSPILIASGSHLQSDTYSTLGLLIGILLLVVSGYKWIDSAAALIFAFIIIYTGYKIIRKSISGIMDESDLVIISRILGILNENRKPAWVDIHNMRVIDYAGFYHIDCHLTVPYYLNINEGHAIMDTLTAMLSEHFDDRVEFFVHIDGCLSEQCKLCSLDLCPKRSTAFIRSNKWTMENVLSNKKHLTLS